VDIPESDASRSVKLADEWWRDVGAGAEVDSPEVVSRRAFAGSIFA